MIGYACPCCGFLTRSRQEYGTYEICPVCGWEDDDDQFENPDQDGCANDVSLNQARENFKNIGASDKNLVDKVRSPLPDEILS
jgi:hypothetical protein